eukprot:CAMPEP_0202941948 /NCGR_PEP_ID=MMETSP1395-20130829/2089_1 /ASSEMBLY_ACC=CAM_ASM_000871 /TAXON_ID=5961 /ORGANISM="Blepharisma japonicum, Strain Stock R1072" /LENGTH=251 /DNA_ID=CAMNT_0049637663 /DNA_START=135 /DNA_END=890 /DNA_ORIENTATION=-
MLEQGIDMVSPIISPFSSRVVEYGSPLVDKLDYTVDSLINLTQEALEKKSLPDGWLKKAKQMAESTSVLILAGADELYLWSSTVFEKYHIEQIYRVPIDASTKALNSIWHFQREMGLRIVDFLDNQREYIANTKVYGKIDQALGIHDKLEAIVDFYDEIKEMKKEDLLEKQWPQDIRNLFDKMLNTVGGESITVYLDDRVWKKLDYDQDGVVTVKDLVDLGNPKSLIEWSKQAFGSVRIPYQINGEIKEEA